LTMNSGRWCSPGIRQTQIRPPDCQMVKRDSSLQRTRFHFSRVQWLRALHHSNWRSVLRTVYLGLCTGALQLKPISWSSRQTVIVLTFPEAVWNSLVSVTSKDRRFLRATALGGPVLWTCVVYHFAAELLLLLDVSTS
jgi:hypothetical protein